MLNDSTGYSVGQHDKRTPKKTSNQNEGTNETSHWVLTADIVNIVQSSSDRAHRNIAAGFGSEC